MRGKGEETRGTVCVLSGMKDRIKCGQEQLRKETRNGKMRGKS